MKILSLIDSFKGTITSKELGRMVYDIFTEKGHEVKSYAIADGGDGFLDAISENIKLERKEITCLDPLSRKILSYYLVSKETNTAYIELAKASGIGLLKESELNPFKATTYGFGETIKDAIINGYKNIVIGIGGSATNDCGSGMLEALGVDFKNDQDILTNMCNDKLGLVKSLDTKSLDKLIEGVSFTVLSDVTNPLLGPNGATYVFSPQKGASKEELPLLEKNIENFSSLNKEYIEYPGSGAAGGVGYALKAYLKAKVVSGIDYLLDLISYDDLHKDFDVIMTGEGKIDHQSMQGKVISSIIKRTKDKRIILVCGINEIKDNYEIYSVCDNDVTKEMSMSNPNYYFQQMLIKINL